MKTHEFWVGSFTNALERNASASASARHSSFAVVLVVPQFGTPRQAVV